MTEPPRPDPPRGDPRVYFAAERTLLAWVRTGLAMMGFGFVVSRFGLFLRELALAGNAPVLRKPGLSMGIGTTLVLLGVAANLGAAIRYWKTIRRLDRGEPLRFHTISLGSAVAVLLALLGAFVALYLLFEPATRPG